MNLLLQQLKLENNLPSLVKDECINLSLVVQDFIQEVKEGVELLYTLHKKQSEVKIDCNHTSYSCDYELSGYEYST